MKLKTDKEYLEIDRKQKEQQKKSDKIFLKNAKEFDKRNRYWLKVLEIMPKEIQEQICMSGSFFVSNGIMLWLSIGDAKTRDIKSQLLKEWEKKLNSQVTVKEKKQ